MATAAAAGQELAQPLAGGGEEDGLHSFEYRRRRPIHPGRFIDFASRHFGVLEHQLDSGSGGGRWRSVCSRRRRNDTEEGIALVDAAGGAAAADAAEACEAWSADWEVLDASGCVWLAGSDDRQADWTMRAAGAAQRVHRLGLGPSWPVPEEPEKWGEAGERRVELRFVLRERRPPRSAPEQREPPQVAERRLINALEACLLSRAEAAALEQGDFRVLDGLGGWRPECEPGASSSSAASRQLPPPLRAVQGIVNIVHAIPGSTAVANLGYALSRTTIRLLRGGTHRHPGHDDGDETCDPTSAAAGIAVPGSSGGGASSSSGSGLVGQRAG
mmetsp:Transcript_57435/g.145649  ORF Transcript_57435/g.145649 Transcript_57435/m.145649 type:complete len:330 (+) Transcript_57435:105-1094(+)